MRNTSDTGSSTAVESVERSLRRIAEREGEISAWVEVDDPGARAAAKAIDSAATPLPLAGLTLGVKDIIEVAGLKCECGSRALEGRRAFSDAPVVARLKSLGMVVVGKTATTEFAYLQPAATRNPLRRDRSPGGSSSGSAAAVADGHVDAALGTQTGGSIGRPAAFCGIVGFKPSPGRVSRAGVLSSAPSLDVVGWLTRDVATAARMYSAYCGEPILDRSAARIGLCRTVHWPIAEVEMRNTINDLATVVAASDIHAVPPELDRIHAVIMGFEMRQELETMLLQHRDAMSERLATYLTLPNITAQDYGAAQARLRGFDVDSLFADAEVLIGPSATGEATAWDSTGDPCFNRFSTLLGLPALTIPVGRGATGMPLGAQIVARPGEDAALFAIARMLEQRLSRT